MTDTALPRLFITLGDVAGVGPEVVAKAWPRSSNSPGPSSSATLSGSSAVSTKPADAAPSSPCCTRTRPGRSRGSSPFSPGPLRTWARSSRAGCRPRRAGRPTTSCASHRPHHGGAADGIVTCPLHKEGLGGGRRHVSGAHRNPGRAHGRRTVTRWCSTATALAVAHVTLHCSLRDALDRMTAEGVLEKIRLLDGLLPKLIGRRPRIAVGCAQPARQRRRPVRRRGGDGLLLPRWRRARAEGIDATGACPNDTLFLRVAAGEFDGVVAMYHDAGAHRDEAARWLAVREHHRRPADRADERGPRHRLRHRRQGAWPTPRRWSRRLRWRAGWRGDIRWNQDGNRSRGGSRRSGGSGSARSAVVVHPFRKCSRRRTRPADLGQLVPPLLCGHARPPRWGSETIWSSPSALKRVTAPPRKKP